jgi:hypothetical protein
MHLLLLPLLLSLTACCCCCCCQVVLAVPTTLRASWEGPEATPTVQLGEQIHDLVIRARNAEGEVRATTAAAVAAAADCLL